MWLIIDLFYAIIFIAMGFWLVKYRRTIKSWTGNFVWAERYIWNGWTYFILTLFGLAMIFFWAMYPFGWVQILFNK